MKRIFKNSPPEVFWQNGNMVSCKYAANLQNTQTRYSDLWKPHICMDVLLYICCMFAKHLWRTASEFWEVSAYPWSLWLKVSFRIKKGTSAPWKQTFSKSYRRSQEPHLKYRKLVTLLSSRSSPPEQRCSANIKKLSDSALLKPYFCMGVLLWICCIFAEHLFRKTSLGNCFCLLT